MNATRRAAYERDELYKNRPDCLLKFTCYSYNTSCVTQGLYGPIHTHWNARGKHSPCPICGCLGRVESILYETKCIACAKDVVQEGYPGAIYCSRACRENRSWKPPAPPLPRFAANSYLNLLSPDLRIELARYCQNKQTHRPASHLLVGCSELTNHFPASDEQFFDPEMFT